MMRGGGAGTSSGVGVAGVFARAVAHPPEASAIIAATRK
jgi:hypothetical protein